jgi:hypothetical protein
VCANEQHILEDDMSLVTVKDNHIKFMSSNYFVGNAQTVSLGSYGEKATPVFGANKLEVKARVPAPKLEGKVRVAGPFGLDAQQSSKSNFDQAVSGSIKVVGISISQGNIYEELVDQHLKFVQLYVDEVPMKNAFNDAPNALDNLRDYGNDARIAHSLLVVMEASFASSFTAGSSYDVSADAAGIVSITAAGGSVVKGKDKVTIAPGTCLAYLLLNPDWNKGKSKIESTNVDEWSVN